jgi:cytochrome c oxidase cbb3-type subunit 3
MRSWKNDLLPSDIQKVASYIKSLKGTNPPGGKAPQGDLYKEEATDAPAATTTTAAPPATEVKTK